MLSVTGGVPAGYIKPIVGSVNENSAAKNVLQVNDRITEINGKKIKNWEDLANAIYKINEKGYNGENISLKYSFVSPTVQPFSSPNCLNKA